MVKKRSLLADSKRKMILQFSFSMQLCPNKSNFRDNIQDFPYFMFLRFSLKYTGKYIDQVPKQVPEKNTSTNEDRKDRVEE